MKLSNTLEVLTPEAWRDYALLDSGEGAKLERFGPYVLERPEPQALWPRALLPAEWARADARYEMRDNGRGEWRYRRPLDQPWAMHYRRLTFWARCTPFRHTGVFADQARVWDWLAETVRPGDRLLNLFGYTGLATLAAAQAGAEVTHVDASKPALLWAKENAVASGLSDRPVRWLHDDVVKFVQREIRRGRRYEGLILDPPPYGHGKDGETWRFFDAFPNLLTLCGQCLSDKPRLIVITAYAIVGSALLLRNLLSSLMQGRGGTISAGELALREQSGGRLLSTAHFARWWGA